MDIIGKILQALLGGERPRTWIDELIVLTVCGTYCLTQALRFVHHQRHRRAVMSASPAQLRVLDGAAGMQPPKAAAALVILLFACAGLVDSRHARPDSARTPRAVLPMCFVRNTSHSLKPACSGGGTVGVVDQNRGS